LAAQDLRLRRQYCPDGPSWQWCICYGSQQRSGYVKRIVVFETILFFSFSSSQASRPPCHQPVRSSVPTVEGDEYHVSGSQYGRGSVPVSDYGIDHRGGRLLLRFRDSAPDQQAVLQREGEGRDWFVLEDSRRPGREIGARNVPRDDCFGPPQLGGAGAGRNALWGRETHAARGRLLKRLNTGENVQNSYHERLDAGLGRSGDREFCVLKSGRCGAGPGPDRSRYREVLSNHAPCRPRRVTVKLAESPRLGLRKVSTGGVPGKACAPLGTATDRSGESSSRKALTGPRWASSSPDRLRWPRQRSFDGLLFPRREGQGFLVLRWSAESAEGSLPSRRRVSCCFHQQRRQFRPPDERKPLLIYKNPRSSFP
jgi:hypothetical protein